MPWESNFFPEEVWNLMTNLGLLVAVIAVLSAIRWLWNRGPQFLIDNGPDWFTTLGNYWHGRRNGDSDGDT